MFWKGTGGRQFATRIALYAFAKVCRSSVVVPATPPAEVRLGALGTVPLIAAGHAGVVALGDGLGEVVERGAGWAESGRSGVEALDREVVVDAALVELAATGSLCIVRVGAGAGSALSSASMTCSSGPCPLGLGEGETSPTVNASDSELDTLATESLEVLPISATPGTPSAAPLATGTANAITAASAVMAVMLL